VERRRLIADVTVLKNPRLILCKRLLHFSDMAAMFRVFGRFSWLRRGTFVIIVEISRKKRRMRLGRRGNNPGTSRQGVDKSN